MLKVPDLEWIAEITKPNLASDADEIAGRLALFKSWKAAAVFYRRAMATPLTDAEARRLGMMSQVFMPEAAVRARFEADTGDWKRAETIFPDAARRLTTKELPEW